MELLTTLRGLSADELRRIRNTLLDRFRSDGRSVAEIGFGQAERGGRPDPQRPEAICLYVREKPRRLRSRTSPLPPEVDIRVRRGSNYVLVRLPTDVIEFGRRTAEATGWQVRHRWRLQSVAVANCLVAWRMAKTRAWQWGVLTTGHLFHSRRVVPEPLPQVRVGARGRTFAWGTLLARTRPRDGSHVDAALVGIELDALLAAGVLEKRPPLRGKAVCPLSDLVQQIGADGVSLSTSGTIPFSVQRYLPLCTLVPELGPLRHVLDVTSSRRGAFGRGRSGSLWVVDRKATCLQFAGLPPQFRQGWGQSLETALDWVRDEVSQQNQVSRASVDVRLMHIV